MKQPFLIYPDGNIKRVMPRDPSYGFTLEECYDLLDCDTIATYSVSDNGEMLMVCDDNAKMKEGWEQNINIMATRMYKEGRMTRAERQAYFNKLREKGVNVMEFTDADPTNSVAGIVLITSREYFK